MTTTHRCPAEIWDLCFSNPKLCFQKTTEWAEALDTEVGDTLIMPGEDGEPVFWEKQPRRDN